MHNLKPTKVRKPQINSVSLSMIPAPTTVVTETTTATCGTITSLPNWTTRATNSTNSKNMKIQFSRTPTTTTCNTNCTISNATTTTITTTATTTKTRPIIMVAIFLLLMSIDGFTSLALVKAENFYASTTPLNLNGFNLTTSTQATTTTTQPTTASTIVATAHSTNTNDTTDDAPLKIGTLHLKSVNDGSGQNHSASTTTTKLPSNPTTSSFKKLAKYFSTGNELWDGIITDCYEHPTFSCFQKNVYSYLSDVLNVNDVNVTQRLKFYRNQLDYNEHHHRPTTEAAVAKDVESSEEQQQIVDGVNNDDHLLRNEIPREGRADAESPIEEVSNALYGKSIKFAMTHDMELKLPEMLFDGATLRISPRSIEGNGLIAKLEFLPKQEVEARLAGKILMNKIKKFLRSKLLLSFVALLLIIKIIKIKLFWLLPIIIGVGAAKKLLLKFLLFLFPALSHLFKLCSYYQQTYHSTKYHHHHHLINHHHTVVPDWHHSEHHEHGPELIYTSPPKGHPSAYLHGAPIHETYGPPASDHYEGGWENSGPGLGSEYISGVNRVAQIDGNSNYFKPHTTNDVNELHAWGLGTTQPNIQQQQRKPATQQQRPPSAQNIQQQQQQLQQQKPHTTSHSFNPFIIPDKQSIFTTNLRQPTQQQLAQQSMPSPVYTPPRNTGNHIVAVPGNMQGLTAAQIAAQYDPTRNIAPQQQQQQQGPELSAHVKEALRIQAEQRIIAQQQKILENQPFVQDGQPIMPKNYDPFYSPLLVKIDKIVEQLGVKDDLCKERLVCSMYKDPNRYSPHSNFISAELSRDTSELQPVANANQSVIRFYRLIQAARDGQDQKDCLRLYPQCNINTE